LEVNGFLNVTTTLKIYVVLRFSTNALIAVVIVAALVAAGLITGLTIGFVLNADKNNGTCGVPSKQTTSQYGNYRFMGVTGSTKICSPVGT
jgi:hypothetical protein